MSTSNNLKTKWDLKPFGITDDIEIECDYCNEQAKLGLGFESEAGFENGEEVAHYCKYHFRKFVIALIGVLQCRKTVITKPFDVDVIIRIKLIIKEFTDERIDSIKLLAGSV